MSDRTHTALRLGAIALLTALCVWPRSSARSHGAEVARAAARAAGPQVPAVETASAKLAGASRTLKLVVAGADEARLTN
jgi:hypothetical protein